MQPGRNGGLVSIMEDDRLTDDDRKVIVRQNLIEERGEAVDNIAAIDEIIKSLGDEKVNVILRTSEMTIGHILGRAAREFLCDAEKSGTSPSGVRIMAAILKASNGSDLVGAEQDPDLFMDALMAIFNEVYEAGLQQNP